MLNMHQSLSSILFPGYRRRVLGLLLLHPEESLHGREIARRTGLPPGTLTRELKRLADVGLLNCERRGNQLAYSANRHSAIFEELAGILRKTSGLADVVAEALKPLTDSIDVAFIFGSVARGTVPLALFGAERYPVFMGRLAVPLLVAMAISPYLGGLAFQKGGAEWTLTLLSMFAVANVILVGALRLVARRK